MHDFLRILGYLETYDILLLRILYESQYGEKTPKKGAIFTPQFIFFRSSMRGST